MDISSLSAWMDKFGPPILAAILSALATSLLMTRFQARRQARREHLDQIKSQVLRPLREELEQFYLPVLQGQLRPVVFDDPVTRVEGSIERAEVIREYRLIPRPKGGREPLPFPESKPPAEPPVRNKELYEDARRRHYRGLIKRLEQFEAGVDGYLARWVSYASDVSRTIAEKGELPVVGPGAMNEDDMWINPYGLAVFIIGWQLGTTRTPIWRGSDRLSIEVDGRRVARAPREELLIPVLAVLDVLSRDLRPADELLDAAKPLKDLAIQLCGELDHLLVTSKLPGRCPLVRV